MLPDRPGRCPALLCCWYILCLAMPDQQSRLHLLPRDRVCELFGAFVRLVVQLLLAGTAMGTVSRTLGPE